MNALRAIIRWISKHRILSMAIAWVTIAGFVAVRVAIQRSQGTLSPPLKRGEIVDAVYGIGTVTATHSYSVKPGVISTIYEIYVKEGDRVTRGTKLADIDHVIYRAPFDGVVNYLPFKVGENVFTQVPALVVTDLSDRYIVVSLEQQGALRVRPGQRAKLSFDSMRNVNFDGVVQSVYSYNSSFLARIDVEHLSSEILPDMTADIAIVIRQSKEALIMPVSAYENGSVWVKRGRSLPYRVAVQIGIVDGMSAEVLNGDLHEGDTLLIRGKVKL